jgi:DNA polymerase-3 subunit beta
MSFFNAISELRDTIKVKDTKDKINNILSSIPPAPKGKVNVISGFEENSKIETISKNKLLLLNGINKEITDKVGNLYLYTIKGQNYLYSESFKRLMYIGNKFRELSNNEKVKEFERSINNAFTDKTSLFLKSLMNISINEDENNLPILKKEDIKVINSLSIGVPSDSEIYVINQKVYTANYSTVKTYNSDIKIDVDFDFSINLADFRKISKSPIVKIDKENTKLLDVNNEGMGIIILDRLFDSDIIKKMQNFTPNHTLKLSANENTILQNINKVVDKRNPKIELNAMLFQGSDEDVNVVATDTKRLAIGKIQGRIPADKIYLVPMKWITDKKIKEISFSDKYTKITSDKFIYFLELINGTFPNWQRIVPSSFDYEVNLSSIQKDLIKELKNIIKQKLEVVKLDFIDNSKLKVIGLNNEDIEEENPIVSSFSIDNNLNEVNPYLRSFRTSNVRVTAFNPKFLLDSLENCEEPIFQVNKPNMPIEILCKKSGLKSIIMPLKIDEETGKLQKVW